ncbi:heavy metal-binding protein HIP-like isoform X2 [Ruditapes philippinarum]|uniref:heavy metal-binding protein HIP-like isoform X2 n=1 Tax=Ruditapes philippinarum TaxID=129788 RepID=UPI00295BBAEE|nr:heavy metal-binding protein HIP-like isoform X2 [Ruditapes philippinarum]
MGFSLLFSFAIVIGIYSYNFSEAREPVCSKFAYEEQLLEKMIRTEIKVETMVNDIKKTEDNVISTLGDIKRAVSDFTDMFADMKENITDEMLKRGDEIKRREESFKKLFEETRTNLTSDMEAKREELTQLQGKLERPPIAFHAHHVADLVLDTSNEIIIFTKSAINEGSGYDISTGIFTAPVGGLYQFSVHTCVFIEKYASIGLVLEGKVIAADINYDNDQYTCSASGAIARVKSGEKVWVKATLSGSNYQLYQDSYRMITFSGMLVNN